MPLGTRGKSPAEGSVRLNFLVKSLIKNPYAVQVDQLAITGLAEGDSAGFMRMPEIHARLASFPLLAGFTLMASPELPMLEQGKAGLYAFIRVVE